MLRKRSRRVGSRQGLMSDFSSLPPPTPKYSRPTTSLFPSPHPFVCGFTGKGLSDSDAVMSPTSILEAKHFSAIGNPFFSDKNPSKPPVEVPGPSSENRHHRWENGESRGIGLGIVDALNDEKNEQKSCKPESRMVLFGSQLKIQIPPAFPATSVDSLQSPIEFGIKTKNLLLGSLSPGSKYPLGSSNLGSEASMTRVFTGSLSLSETELSEDYTCVITHGPNPKTTHIFDNYIVESCGNCHSALRKGTCFLPNQLDYPSAGFLSFCHACKKGLGQGKDTYIYRFVGNVFFFSLVMLYDLQYNLSL
uniref:FLZ-type domain-containing protein n=1 Tax=Anthurium amnicola TaxID=1678845 RepID=A0A1D1YRV5_9ARAE